MAFHIYMYLLPNFHWLEHSGYTVHLKSLQIVAQEIKMVVYINQFTVEPLLFQPTPNSLWADYNYVANKVHCNFYKYGNLLSMYTLPPDTIMFVAGIPWNKVMFQTIWYIKASIIGGQLNSCLLFRNGVYFHMTVLVSCLNTV